MFPTAYNGKEPDASACKVDRADCIKRASAINWIETRENQRLFTRLQGEATVAGAARFLLAERATLIHLLFCPGRGDVLGVPFNSFSAKISAAGLTTPSFGPSAIRPTNRFQ